MLPSLITPVLILHETVSDTISAVFVHPDNFYENADELVCLPIFVSIDTDQWLLAPFADCEVAYACDAAFMTVLDENHPKARECLAQINDAFRQIARRRDQKRRRAVQVLSFPVIPERYRAQVQTP